MTAAKKTAAVKPADTTPEAEPVITDPATGTRYRLVRDDAGAPIGIETTATARP